MANSWLENQQVFHQLSRELYSKDIPITITLLGEQGLQQNNYLICPVNESTTNAQKFVLRIYLDIGVGEMRHEREYEMMTWIRDRGHTFCPRVVYHDWSSSLIPYRFMVQEYISGVPIMSKGYQPGYITNDVLTKIASVLKVIHNVERDPNTTTESDNKLYHHQELTVAGFEYSKYISEDFHKLATGIWNRTWQITLPYLEYFSKLKRDRLVHGDCHFSNTIDRGDHYYMVDWEMSCTGHPFEDLGTFISTTLPLTPEQENFLLKCYGFDFTPENNLVLWLYKIRRVTFIIGYIGTTVHELHTGKRASNDKDYIRKVQEFYQGSVMQCAGYLDKSPIKT